MQIHRLKLISLGPLAAIVLIAAAAHAASVTGTVRNGTSGKPAAGVDVVLLQLQGDMKPVASAKTDAQGRYTIENADVGRDAMPLLVRAIYRGVNFHQPLPPGQTTADVTVFEPSSDPNTIKVATRILMFQPNGADLLVVDDYALQNTSQPPVAFYNAQGNFEFLLPEGAQNPQVSSWGPSKMPVTQGTINRGNNKYAIAYAFQPGDNGVRITYQVPYPSNSATLKLVSSPPAERIGLVAPVSVKIQSAGFVQQGQEQGFNLYSRNSLPAGSSFEVAISGTAPLPSAADDSSPSAGGAASSIQVLPNRLDSIKWMLLGGFALLFSLGIISLWRRSPAAGSETAAPPPSFPGNPRRKPGQQKMPASINGPAKASSSPAAAVAFPAADSAAPSAPAAAAVASVEREVEQNLESLKDKLFRLELRRQAGTISEGDYLRERTQAEKVLRELVGR